MRHITTSLILGLGLNLALAVISIPSVAQGAEPDKAAAQKAWAEYATPGPAHEELKKMVGVWKTEAKDFYENPDSPSTSHGTAKFKMIMGGRYLQQEFTGEFGGQKFEGLGCSGYDNSLKKYVGTWIDSMGTGIMHTRGEYDPQTKTMTETGESSSPMGKMDMKLTTKHVSDDKFVFTMSMVLPDGKLQKTMEITYSRQ